MAKSETTTRPRKRASTKRASPRAQVPPPADAVADDSGLIGMARQVRSWSDSVLGIAGAAADASIGAAKALLVRPEQRATLEKAGSLLKNMRETAGLSLREVGDAINLKDEVILRLASVLGRNDPISFVMRFTRSYNPDTWHTLERLGIGRLAVQAGREREFANVYRASDAARRLDDEEFAAVLGFVKAAFELALTFHARAPSSSPVTPPARRRK